MQKDESFLLEEENAKCATLSLTDCAATAAAREEEKAEEEEDEAKCRRKPKRDPLGSFCSLHLYTPSVQALYGGWQRLALRVGNDGYISTSHPRYFKKTFTLFKKDNAVYFHRKETNACHNITQMIKQTQLPSRQNNHLKRLRCGRLLPRPVLVTPKSLLGLASP